MKAFWLTQLLVLFLVGIGYGQLDNDPPPGAMFEIERIGLDPETFVVTLEIATRSLDYYYGMLVCDGPATVDTQWQVLQLKRATGDTLVFTDDVSGSLTHIGKTYRGFIALEPDAPSSSWVMTVNDEFIAYPFLSEPRLAAVPVTGMSNELQVTYGEGIYSNAFCYTIPDDLDSGFIRVVSTNNDPVNVVIQISTNGLTGSWSELPRP